MKAGRRPALAAAGVAMLATATGAAPLPPPRPVSPDSPGPAAPAPAVTPPPAPAIPDVAASPCLAALAAERVTAEPVAQPGTGACLIAEPVRLRRAGRPGDGPAIAFPDEPTMACALARAVSAWTVAVAGPALAAERGAALLSVRTGPGFECRTRNRQPDAKPSAHGTGLALDIAGFAFADGETLPVGGPEGRGSAALAAVRRAACGWFTTVLGPGSDPFHADHLHLDLLLHGSSDRYRICQ